jgi:hypothetical protein
MYTVTPSGAEFYIVSVLNVLDPELGGSDSDPEPDPDPDPNLKISDPEPKGALFINVYRNA